MRKIMTLVLAVSTVFSVLSAPAAASFAGDTARYTTDYSAGVFNTSTTTDEPVSTVGVTTTEDRVDKNTALEPPPYGIFGGYIATDCLNPYYDNYNTASSEVASASGSAWQMLEDSAASGVSTVKTYETAVKYFDNGTIGTLSIPVLGIAANIYEGATSTSMANGIGHIEGTSAWDGNVAIAGHNRGSSSVIIGGIKDLESGDVITYKTPYGTRDYSVCSVEKVLYTDTSCLAQSFDRNVLTLITCVSGQSAYRWVVKAAEVK